MPWEVNTAERAGMQITTTVDEVPALAPLGGDRFIPARYRITVERPGRPLVHMTAVVERGRPVCTDLRLERRPDGPPISSEMLREVPLATILRESVAVAGRVRVHRAQGDNTVPAEGKVLDFEVREYEYGSPEVAAEIQARLIESYDARSGAPLSDDVLRRVADIYRAAHAAGDPPTRTVMLAFNVSRSTAGRYVQRARERGFLGPTRQRVAAP